MLAFVNFENEVFMRLLARLFIGSMSCFTVLPTILHADEFAKNGPDSFGRSSNILYYYVKYKLIIL